jgi:hypothetical protein
VCRGSGSTAAGVGEGGEPEIDGGYCVNVG